MKQLILHDKSYHKPASPKKSDILKEVAVSSLELLAVQSTNELREEEDIDAQVQTENIDPDEVIKKSTKGRNLATCKIYSVKVENINKNDSDILFH